MRSAPLQAASLRQTRRAHATETAEDYVEAIADLTLAMGEARVVVAERVGYDDPVARAAVEDDRMGLADELEALRLALDETDRIDGDNT